MKKIGETFLAAGLITESQLTAALGEQARWGNRLGETLVQLGFLEEQQLIRVLSKRSGFPGVDLAGRTIAPEILSLVPAEIAQKYSCLPIVKERDGGRDVVYVAMEDPSNLTAADDLSFRTGCLVRACLAGPVQIRKAISLCYDGIEEHDQAVLLEFDEPGRGRGAEELLDERWLDDLVEPEVGVAPESPPPQAPSVQESAAVAAPEGAREDAEAGPRRGPPPPPSGKPKDVPTRQILQAMTRLLIEKGVITREELMAEIRELPPTE